MYDVTQALLPCPFCGGEAAIINEDRTWIECLDCPSKAVLGPFDSYAETDAIAAWNARLSADAAPVEAVHVVFDGPPGHDAGRFVECETPDGRSFNAGEWHERSDGFWELRIKCAPPSSDVAELVEALDKAAMFVGWASLDSQVLAGVHADELAVVIDALLAKHGGAK